MTKAKAENLIMCAFDLDNKSHQKYLGFIHCLKLLAITDKTLSRKMKSEGLIF